MLYLNYYNQIDFNEFASFILGTFFHCGNVNCKIVSDKYNTYFWKLSNDVKYARSVSWYNCTCSHIFRFVKCTILNELTLENEMKNKIYDK